MIEEELDTYNCMYKCEFKMCENSDVWNCGVTILYT